MSRDGTLLCHGGMVFWWNDKQMGWAIHSVGGGALLVTVTALCLPSLPSKLCVAFISTRAGGLRGGKHGVTWACISLTIRHIPSKQTSYGCDKAFLL